MSAQSQDHASSKLATGESWLESGQRVAVPEEVTLTQLGGVESPLNKRYERGAIIAGKYQLVDELGEGAMGSVWVAKNRILDVDVAIKLLRPDFANVQAIAERMLQEARAAACIGHPAIVQTFDFGYSELGDPFIVMEILRGESLEQALGRRHRVSPVRAVRTLLPIVDALAATHAQGIVHRDLKPANIFLARLAGQRLQPKVLDFGVAKLERRSEKLTLDGALIGSPAYMSPEQILGGNVIDGRVDIWGLCVVLYEMITSELPFDIDDDGSILRNVLTANPKPLIEHGLDEPALWSLLEKGLAKNPAERFASMRALGAKLAEWLVARGVHEDICDAALRPWLNQSETGAEPEHSFFPSREPGGAQERRLPVSVQVRQGVARVSRRAVSSSRLTKWIHTSFSTPMRKGAWVAISALVFGFLAVFVFRGRSMTASRGGEPRNSTIPTAAPMETPLPEVESSSPMASTTAPPVPSAEPQVTQAEVAPETPKVVQTRAPAARTRATPPKVSREKSSRDLKNPFQ